MEEFTLINKKRDRIKIFKPFEDVSKPSQTINAMENIGFKLVEKRYPYIKSPYSNPLLDHIKFLLKILGMNTKFPFWKNSMDLIFEKQ